MVLWTLAALKKVNFMYQDACRDPVDALAWSSLAGRLRQLIPEKYAASSKGITSTSDPFDLLKAVIRYFNPSHLQIAANELLVKLGKVINSDFMEAASIAKDLLIVENLTLKRDISDWLAVEVSTFQIKQRLALMPTLSLAKRNALHCFAEDEPYETSRAPPAVSWSAPSRGCL